MADQLEELYLQWVDSDIEILPRLDDELSRVLRASGFDNTSTTALVHWLFPSQPIFGEDAEVVTVLNTLGENYSGLRTSMVPGLLELSVSIEDGVLEAYDFSKSDMSSLAEMIQPASMNSFFPMTSGSGVVLGRALRWSLV